MHGLGGFSRSRTQWDYFITLNFSHSVKEHTAQYVIKKFIKNLNIAIFGKRSKKAINIVVALEKHKSGDYHVHILTQDPIERINTTRQQSFDLKEIIRTNWQNTHSSTAIIRLSSNNDQEWFKKIYQQRGIIEYVTKEIEQGRWDAIQYDLMNTSGRRHLP